MRALVSRSRGLLLPSSVVCAALIFGPVGTAVAVNDATRDAYASLGAGTSWSSTFSASARLSSAAATPSTATTPSSYANRVLNRLGALDRADRGDVLTPVLKVLTDVTEQTGTGRMTAAQAAGFATAVDTANASLKKRLVDRTGTSNRAAALMADPISDLLDQLSATLDGLLDTVTGLVGGLLDTVTGLLGGLLDSLGDLLDGLLGGLPPLPVEVPPVELPPAALPPAALPLEPPPAPLPALPALPPLPAAGTSGTSGAAGTVR